MTERQAMPLRLGVVANIQVGPEAEATAALVLHELGRRLGAIELTAITLTEPQRPTTRSSWSAPNAAGQADFYIHSVSDEALDHWGIAAERRLRTTLFDSDFPLTAAYATTVDPFAAEARRLMLDHIGVSATHSSEELTGFVSALDAFVLDQLDTGPTDITGVTAEFDRLATEIQTNEYTGAVDRLGWLEARLTKLTTELAKAHNDADQAHRRELLLAERLEASESGQQA
jgi:hypothetical protein